MKRLSGVFVTVLLILFSCSGDSPDEKTEDDREQELEKGWELLSTDNYLMKYPKDWELDDSGDMGTEFILFNPSSSSESFKENINLLILPLGEKIRTLDEFVEVSEMQVATNLIDGKIVYSSRGKLNGMICHSMAYEGQVGLNSLRFEQFYISVGDAIYILTMTCLVDNYDRFSAVTNEIMATFKVKD